MPAMKNPIFIGVNLFGIEKEGITWSFGFSFPTNSLNSKGRPVHHWKTLDRSSRSAQQESGPIYWSNVHRKRDRNLTSLFLLIDKHEKLHLHCSPICFIFSHAVRLIFQIPSCKDPHIYRQFSAFIHPPYKKFIHLTTYTHHNTRFARTSGISGH